MLMVVSDIYMVYIDQQLFENKARECHSVTNFYLGQLNLLEFLDWLP